jgi:hypothetical protein
VLGELCVRDGKALRIIREERLGCQFENKEMNAIGYSAGSTSADTVDVLRRLLSGLLDSTVELSHAVPGSRRLRITSFSGHCIVLCDPNR